MERTFASIERSTLASAFLSAEDTRFLLTRRDQLLQQLAQVRFVLPPTLIHGDAHHRNTLWDSANHRGVLCDWENASLGQPEWDLTTLEVHCRRFEHPRHEYAEFVERYGCDIRDWSGYQWLRDVRELRMITTNARKSTPGSANAHEVQRRVAALRAGAQIGWRIM
jgi:aminoglycoside phosphotransferase (APT) family kinase protein